MSADTVPAVQRALA
jgi:alkylation response protein AidB-like acyl-CoA dehydrogenase